MTETVSQHMADIPSQNYSNVPGTSSHGTRPTFFVDPDISGRFRVVRHLKVRLSLSSFSSQEVMLS